MTLKVFPLEFADHAHDQVAPLARLHHPSIVRVFEMGETEEHYFYAQEYVERTLADRLRDGPLRNGDAVRQALAVVSALEYARDQGVAPLSLSPKSILLTDQDIPKLSRFCAMGAFQSSPHVHHPALLPPEWLSGGVTTVESTLVYWAGALLYEMLTGRPPFAVDSMEATVRRVLRVT